MQPNMSNTDTGFMLVTSKKPLPKKQHAVDDQQHMQPAFITAICIHFPMVSNGKNAAFNLPTHVKAVLDAMCITDASISVQPITALGDCQNSSRRKIPDKDLNFDRRQGRAKQRPLPTWFDQGQILPSHLKRYRRQDFDRE